MTTLRSDTIRLTARAQGALRTALLRTLAGEPDLTDAAIAETVRKVRSVLSLRPDLLKPLYRALVEKGANPLTGHCYIASESVYHLLGGKAAGLKPVSLAHEGSIHWWLVTKSGQVIDATADQFATPVPYEKGHARGFLTREPSARAREVIRRVT